MKLRNKGNKNNKNQPKCWENSKKLNTTIFLINQIDIQVFNINQNSQNQYAVTSALTEYSNEVCRVKLFHVDGPGAQGDGVTN